MYNPDCCHGYAARIRDSVQLSVGKHGVEENTVGTPIMEIRKMTLDV